MAMKNIQLYIRHLVLFMLVLVITALTVHGQQRTIAGTVRDEAGETLIGVSVVIKNTTIGVTTDFYGNYLIEVPSRDVILVFSYIGYQMQETVVGDRSLIDVVMKRAIIDLDEVVVIGYGSVRKSDLTGSVSSVRVEDMEGVSMTSIEQGLQGRISGVWITQTDASPDGGLSMVIRGSNSLIGGTEPLYVIDGIPISGGNEQLRDKSDFMGPSGDQQASTQGPNLLSFLNPNDIESIEILKDASATAIYGARAANGVVIINTKTGQNRPATINFSLITDTSIPYRRWDLLNGEENANHRNLGEVVSRYTKAYNWNTGQPGIYYDQIILPYDGTYNNDGTYRPKPEDFSNGVAASTDWEDIILRNSVARKYSLNTTGGSGALIYYFSGSYDDIQGPIVNSNFERFSFNANVRGKIRDNLTIRNSLLGVRTFGNRSFTNAGHFGDHSGLLFKAYKMSPLNLVGAIYYGEEEEMIGSDDPYTMATQFVDNRTNYNLLNNMSLDWEIIKDLVFKVSGAVNYRNDHRDVYYPLTTRRGLNAGNGMATYASGGNIYWLNENILTYRFKANRHSFDFLTGFTQEQTILQNRRNSVNDFLTDLTSFYNMEAAAQYDKPASSYSEFYIKSYLGRINYNYDNRYLLTASYRADGSSKFGAENKWGYFPSAAFAWRASQEEFIKKIAAIYDLKFRVSYGVTGNTAIQPYQSLPQLSPFSYPFNNAVQIGYQNSVLDNPNLRWEKTKQTNFGIDFGLWRGKFSVTADYYIKRTEDLLQMVRLSPSTGWFDYVANLGSLENKGLELQVFGVLVDKAFKWDVTGTWFKNEIIITDLGDVDTYPGRFVVRWNWNPFEIRVGEPLGIIYGNKVSHVIRTPEESANAAADNPNRNIGEMDLVKDENGNAAVVAIGNTNPDFSFGFTSRMSYKGLSLSFHIAGSIGQDILNMNAYDMIRIPQFQTLNSYLDRFWVPEILNSDGSVAIPENEGDWHLVVPISGRQFMNNHPTDLIIEDGSYVKLRNVTLTYAMPAKYRPAWLKGLRPFVSVNNVFSIDNYSGLDPETSLYGQDPTRRGVAMSEFPLSRTWSFGLNVTF